METSVDSSLSSSTITTTSVHTPASSFVNLFLNEVNYQDVHGLLDTQRSLLEQLDKTNEKLDGINRLSAKRYLDATREFSNHTQMLKTMKSDLDLIFKKIKLLKVRLSKKYPEAYESVIRNNSVEDDLLDDEDEGVGDLVSATPKSTKGASLVKSKTIDCSQFSSTTTDNPSSMDSVVQRERTTNSFDAVRNFVLDKSSGASNLTLLLQSARDEIKKINDGLLGNQNSKPSDNNDQ